MKEGATIIPQEVLEQKRSERATIVYMKDWGKTTFAPVYDLAARRENNKLTPPHLYLITE